MAYNEKHMPTVMLVVQGEGRGHLTQAISVQEMLQKKGIDICCVVVGSSSRREIPAFFREKFSCPIVSLPSPNFVTDSRNKAIRVGPTLWRNGLRIGKYMHGIRIIRKLVTFHQPRLIINFYEPLVGLYQFLYGGGPKVLSIAHQYVYLHPAFRFPAGSWLEQKTLRYYTKLTAIGSEKILAISSYDLPALKGSRLAVVPPVLRNEVRQALPTDEQFILVYLLNEGYMDEVLQWHQKYPDTRLHCFTDSKKVREQYKGLWQVDERLSFHALDDTLFLSMLASCSGLATTAGFETVCEAHYLGKPVFMVPVAGHFEQYCNARDFARIGAGLYDSRFRLEKFREYLPFHAARASSYRSWVEQAENMIMEAIQDFTKESPDETNSRPSLYIMPGGGSAKAAAG